MKKALMFLMMASCVGTVSANNSFEGLKSENIHVSRDSAVNNSCKNEYVPVVADENLQEYEQHVCDNTTPPKVSDAMAFLTSVGGRVLIEFITLRESLRRHFISLKATINKWITAVIG